jgi:serine protease Do
MDIDSPRGALVSDVVDDGPAAEAGIEDGDVIVTMDDDEIEDAEDLIRGVGRRSPKDSVHIEILRNGEPRGFDVVLGARPEEKKIVKRFLKQGREGAPDSPGVPRWIEKHIELPRPGARLGVRVVDLNEDLGSYFKSEEGALVVEVLDDSPAEEAGLKAGDVITSVGDRDIEDAEDLVDAIHDARDAKKVQLSVMRHGASRTIEAEIEEPVAACPLGRRDERDVFRLRRPGGMQFFSIPELDEDIEGLEDLPEFRDEMQDLKEELEHLKLELRDLKRDLERGKHSRD